MYTLLPSMYPTSGYMGVPSVPASQDQSHSDSIQRRQSVPSGMAPYPPYMVPFNYMTYHGQNPFHQTAQHPHQPIVMPHHWQPHVVYPQFEVRSAPQQQHPGLHGQNDGPTNPVPQEVIRPPKPHSPVHN